MLFKLNMKKKVFIYLGLKNNFIEFHEYVFNTSCVNASQWQTIMNECV